MTNLERLIQELCPNGVPLKKVKDVYIRLKGTPITAGKMKEIACEDGEIRVFAGGKTVVDAHEKDIPKANITRIPAVLVQSRGVIDVVYYDKPFTFKNEMWAYTADDSVRVKYLYHVLKNSIKSFRDVAMGMGSLPQISLPVTEEFMLPVPPLDVQREIVRMLDSFMLLTTELKAELVVRKKQYDFYRNRLLTYNSNIQNIQLQDIAKFTYGYTDKAQDKGDTRFIRITDIDDNGCLNPTGAKYINLSEDSQKYLLHKGDLLLARTGATYGKTLYYPPEFATS